MRSVALMTALTLAPIACLAEDMPAPPGCVDVVTIQSANCTVRRVAACDNPDAAFQVGVYEPDGLTFSLNLGPDGGVTRIVQPPWEDYFVSAVADPISAPTLHATGSDTFDYTMSIKGGGDLQYVGTTKLTGETVTISGHVMAVTQTWEQTFSAEGLQETQDIVGYFDADMGFVIGGREIDAATGAVALDRTPVALLFPGEPGALSVTPLHGCGGQ